MTEIVIYCANGTVVCKPYSVNTVDNLESLVHSKGKSLSCFADAEQRMRVARLSVRVSSRTVAKLLSS